jgi:hypothetical protein
LIDEGGVIDKALRFSTGRFKHCGHYSLLHLVVIVGYPRFMCFLWNLVITVSTIVFLSNNNEEVVA